MASVKAPTAHGRGSGRRSTSRSESSATLSLGDLVPPTATAQRGPADNAEYSIVAPRWPQVDTENESFPVRLLNVSSPTFGHTAQLLGALNSSDENVVAVGAIWEVLVAEPSQREILLQRVFDSIIKETGAVQVNISSDERLDLERDVPAFLTETDPGRKQAKWDAVASVLVDSLHSARKLINSAVRSDVAGVRIMKILKDKMVKPLEAPLALDKVELFRPRVDPNDPKLNLDDEKNPWAQLTSEHTCEFFHCIEEAFNDREDVLRDYRENERARNACRAAVLLHQSRHDHRNYLPKVAFIAEIRHEQEEKEDPDPVQRRTVAVLYERLGERVDPGQLLGGMTQNEHARRRVVKSLMRGMAALHSHNIGHHRLTLRCLRYRTPATGWRNINQASERNQGAGAHVVITDFSASQVYPPRNWVDRADVVQMPPANGRGRAGPVPVKMVAYGPFPQSVTPRSAPQTLEDYHATWRYWGQPPPELKLGHQSMQTDILLQKPQDDFAGVPRRVMPFLEIGMPTDIWDAGMIIAQLHSMTPPTPANVADDTAIDAWIDGHARVHAKVKALLKLMLRVRPKHRATAQQLVASHSGKFMAGYDEDARRGRIGGGTRWDHEDDEHTYEEAYGDRYRRRRRGRQSRRKHYDAYYDDHEDRPRRTRQQQQHTRDPFTGLPRRDIFDHELACRVPRGLQDHPVCLEHVRLLHENRELRHQIDRVGLQVVRNLFRAL